MPREPFTPVLKPAAQHDADVRGIDATASTIATELEILALAVYGLAQDLGGNPEENCGDAIVFKLRGLAEQVRDLGTRSSPLDMEATKRMLRRAMGEVRS